MAAVEQGPILFTFARALKSRSAYPHQPPRFALAAEV